MREFLDPQEVFRVAGHEKIRLSGCCHGKKVIVSGVRREIDTRQLVQYERSVEAVDEHAKLSRGHEFLKFRIAACTSKFSQLRF